MFQEWGFLISEMVLLIILAALLGLLVGWIIWGRRKADTGAGAGASAALRADLDACRAKSAEKDRRITALEAELKQAEALIEAAETAAMEAAGEAVAVAEAVEADHGKHPVHPVAAMPEPAAEPAKDYDGDGVVEGTGEGVKPATLKKARGGKPDDLKQIKGVGPKLEKLCNELGFWHFDQIAAWTADEVAWVDANLQGFKGRVSRDGWVDQAKVLAAGGTTDFANKVKKGGVYD
ncbi:MAG: hypothetical protein KDK10_18490 [Maritimibacter sp.]|nr:hypothetical protein [Maritimibacter sp.]